MLRVLAVLLLGLALPKATIPTADKPGTRDNPLLKRYEGSYIVFSERKSFAEFTLPVSRLEQVPDKKDGKTTARTSPAARRLSRASTPGSCT